MMIHEQKAAYVFAEKSVLHGGKNLNWAGKIRSR